jgi:hypothetical protein
MAAMVSPSALGRIFMHNRSLARYGHLEANPNGRSRRIRFDWGGRVIKRRPRVTRKIDQNERLNFDLENKGQIKIGV